MIAQSGIKNYENPKPIKYVALMNCMLKVKDLIIEKKRENVGTKISIHCPKFGSFRAGGNWDFIEELIFEIWIANKIDVTVYDYPQI
jgi:hypothetical protein